MNNTSTLRIGDDVIVQFPDGVRKTCRVVIISESVVTVRDGDHILPVDKSCIVEHLSGRSVLYD